MEELYEATREQVHSWNFHDRYAAHQNHQIITLESELIDPDLAAFDKAVEYLVVRHESLRTYFVKQQEVLKQCIIPFDRTMFLPVRYDFSKCSSAGRKMALVVEDMKRILSDLGKPPLMCCAVFKFSEDKYKFCFMIHHIISDEWSKGIIYKELSTQYELFKHGKNASLPPMRMQLKDYAKWQSNWLNENSDAARNYWSQKLSSFAEIDRDQLNRHYRPIFEYDNSQKFNKKDLTKPKIEAILDTAKAAMSTSSIHGEEYVLINKFVRNEKFSVGAVLNASFKLLFHIIIGRNEVLLAMPVVNRFIQGTETIIGGLGGGIYLRQVISPDMTIRKFIREGYIEYLKAAGTLIFDHLEMKLDGDVLRLFTDLYVNFMNRNITSGGKLLIPSSDNHVILNDLEYYSISCIIIEYNDGLLFQWKYNTSIYSTLIVNELKKTHLLLLQLMVRNPEVAIRDLTSLFKEEN